MIEIIFDFSKIALKSNQTNGKKDILLHKLLKQNAFAAKDALLRFLKDYEDSFHQGVKQIISIKPLKANDKVKIDISKVTDKRLKNLVNLFIGH
jgi:hypothetical protein